MNKKSSSSAVGVDRSAVLRWFSGRARERADLALDAIEAAAADGQWGPGARSVKAALNKSNVAARFAADNEATLRGLRLGVDGLQLNAGFGMYMAMRYGQAARAADVLEDCRAIAAAGGATEEQRRVLGVVADFAAAYAGIDEVTRRLDSARPRPVYSRVGVSPTVARTLAEIGLNLDATTVRVCEVEWRDVVVEEDGEKKTWRLGLLIWPENAVFGASRFASEGAFRRCHACGHGIKNPFNWVPLLIDDAGGVPHSLWTGRDCAEKIFGVRMRGEASYKDGPGDVGNTERKS